jgi:hypothetical protein
MLYAALWRALPGPTPLRALTALALTVAAIAFCFLWLFPRIAPLMPFNDNTIDPAGPHAAGAFPAYTVSVARLGGAA